MKVISTILIPLFQILSIQATNINLCTIDSSEFYIICPSDTTIYCDYYTTKYNSLDEFIQAGGVAYSNPYKIKSFEEYIDILNGETYEPIYIVHTLTITNEIEEQVSCQQKIKVSDEYNDNMICPPNDTVYNIDEIPSPYTENTINEFNADGGNYWDNCGFVFYLANEQKDSTSSMLLINRYYEAVSSYGFATMCTHTIVVQKPTIINLLELNVIDDIRIFPNPTSGYIFLQIESMNSEFSLIQLYNEVGQLQIEKKVKAYGMLYEKLDVSSLKKGNYIVKVIDDKNTIVKKLILQ